MRVMQAQERPTREKSVEASRIECAFLRVSTAVTLQRMIQGAKPRAERENGDVNQHSFMFYRL